jgi:hypothetical protein
MVWISSSLLHRNHTIVFTDEICGHIDTRSHILRHNFIPFKEHKSNFE